MSGKTGKAFGWIFWILFLCSFAPYACLAVVAIFGANTGFFNYSWTYGGSTVGFIATLLCVVPVIPCCLLYQILYSIIALRKASVKRKKGVLILMASLVALIVIPTSIYDARRFFLDRMFYDNNFSIVENYMRETLSPEIADSAECVNYDRNERRFQVKVNCDVGSLAESDNPVIYISYVVFEDGTVVDDSVIHFVSANNHLFHQELCEYASSSNNLPDNWTAGVELESIDLSSYHLGDPDELLLPGCEYSLGSIYIDAESYDQDEVLEAIALYRSQYADVFGIDNPNFYVRVDGRYIASIWITDTDEGYFLNITGYTYEGETTIKNCTLEIIEGD